MWNLCVVGAGNIGKMIAMLLKESPNYSVTVIDHNSEALSQISCAEIQTHQLDVRDEVKLINALVGFDAVISALPFFLTPAIARAARVSGLHYFDITEDVASTDVVRDLAEGSDKGFMPHHPSV